MSAFAVITVSEGKVKLLRLGTQRSQRRLRTLLVLGVVAAADSNTTDYLIVDSNRVSASEKDQVLLMC